MDSVCVFKLRRASESCLPSQWRVFTDHRVMHFTSDKSVRHPMSGMIPPFIACSQNWYMASHVSLVVDLSIGFVNHWYWYVPCANVLDLWPITIWLVVWNIFFFSRILGKTWSNFIIPTDKLIFQRGRAQPPTSYGTWDIYGFRNGEKAHRFRESANLFWLNPARGVTTPDSWFLHDVLFPNMFSQHLKSKRNPL